MTKEKKILWKDWRFWVGVIAVVIVIGAVAGGGKKEDSSLTTNTKSSATQENILEKGQEKIASIGSQVVVTEKCAIMKTADLGESGIKDDPTYNINAFFNDCLKEKNAPEDMDDETAYNYIQSYAERINASWESRKDETIKGKTLETYLLEWAAEK